MEKHRKQLRRDRLQSPAFVMVQTPPPRDERSERSAEWVLAIWMNLLDPNVMGVRKVNNEADRDGVAMIHVAIPIGYKRRYLALTLAIAQIEDEEHTPRVNVSSSVGTDKPHSFICVPAEVIFSRFASAMEFQLLDATEHGDSTIRDLEPAARNIPRIEKRTTGEDDARLRHAIRERLALKNARISRDQIQVLINKKTRERWIKIKNVDRAMRAIVRSTIKDAGIRAIAPAGDASNLDWSIVFAATDASKLLVD